MKSIATAAALMLALAAAAPLRAQEAGSKPAADTSAAALPRLSGRDPCSDPIYLQLRRIPPDRMDDSQKRVFEQMDRDCADARLQEARARVAGAMGGSVSRVDYEAEVLPWVMGIGVFCTAVIIFAQTLNR